MKITIKNPYNTTNLNYNQTTGRYELSLAYVKANFDYSYNDDGVLSKRISMTSRLIYNYIFTHSYSGNRRVINFMLNYTEEGRKFIFDILNEQIEADLLNARNNVKDSVSANATGQVLPRQAIQQDLVSVSAENIIDNSNGYFGFNICVLAPFPSELFRLVIENEGA